MTWETSESAAPENSKSDMLTNADYEDVTNLSMMISVFLFYSANSQTPLQ